jgi:hypothetical protein
MDRMLITILVLAGGETAWALLCAYVEVNILIFYAVLVAASAVFWIPGLSEKRADTPQERLERTAAPSG